MKKLTRVKLINWHRFVNATIDLEKSTLISGENGAGKSTLLDAIQFVIICSTNYFNKAAHENGKRKLTGYIRCKTGRENKPYERTGEISAHVALEIFCDRCRGRLCFGGTGKNGKIFDGRSTIRGLYVFSRKSAKVYQSVSDNE